jgi:hypothetical protein
MTVFFQTIGNRFLHPSLNVVNGTGQVVTDDTTITINDDSKTGKHKIDISLPYQQSKKYYIDFSNIVDRSNNKLEKGAYKLAFNPYMYTLQGKIIDKQLAGVKFDASEQSLDISYLDKFNNRVYVDGGLHSFQLIYNLTAKDFVSYSNRVYVNLDITKIGRSQQMTIDELDLESNVVGVERNIKGSSNDVVYQETVTNNFAALNAALVTQGYPEYSNPVMNWKITTPVTGISIDAKTGVLTIENRTPLAYHLLTITCDVQANNYTPPTPASRNIGF